ncbi:protein of unknown function [Magnetospira sp. QH-2]|nr:protein of unknown function [Magnetospira sp. QH-2]
MARSRPTLVISGIGRFLCWKVLTASSMAHHEAEGGVHAITVTQVKGEEFEGLICSASM